MIIKAAAFAVMLGAYIGYINGANQIGMLLIFMLSGAIAILYSYLFYIRGHAEEQAEQQHALIDGLYEIYYYRGRRSTVALSISQAAKNIAAVASAPFLELSKRIRFGEEIQVAFDRAATKITHNKFDWMGSRITESRNSIQNFLSLYESEAKKKEAKRGARIQTGATISMFVSTILPAFIIFSFIGGTIISSNGISLFALSVLMLVAIPAAYAIISVVQYDHVFKK